MESSKRRLPTGTVTFLFSDIEDSTRLVQELDTSDYRNLIEQHHRLMREAFNAHGGTERGSQGDGFLVVFADASSAVRAAVDAQRSLAAADWPDGRQVRVRIGMHTGRGVLGGDDYLGIDINTAARIASAAHGGQILISETTRSLAERSLPDGVAVRDAGVHRLKGIVRPEHLHQLTIEGLRSDFPPLGTARVASAHLPSRLTSFVGRRAEIDELEGLVARSRLVTLVGPGGCGKTSLAIEVAREVAEDFTEGAWFVDLAPVADPGLVGPTVARRLGLSEQSDLPILDILKTHISTRELLLLLDNFEHLLPATDVVADLLATAPDLKIMVTSRSALNVYGEQEFSVQPLGLPDPDDTLDLEKLTVSEAVALFLDRAAAVKPGFSINEENASAVRDICVRMDGLPLAIELVASRVRVLTPREIIERLEQRLPVLSTSARDRPERQRTLEKTIEWSYELVPPVEQELFIRLCVFAGGCTLEAVEAVCNPDGVLGIDTLDGIASLLDQSLIRQVDAGSVSRFEMLETIREFGRSRLSSLGSLDEIVTRHLHYYCDLAEVAESHLMGPDQGEWLDRVENEHDNLRAALRTAVDQGDTERGLRLAASMWRFWFHRGYLREGRSWLETLLASDSDSVSRPRAKAYSALGGLTFWLADPEATERSYESAMSLYRQIGDEKAAAEEMYNLAFVPAMRDRLQDARSRFEAGIAEAKRVGSEDLVARNQIMLGLNALAGGDPDNAVSYFEEALAFFRQVGDRFHIAWTTRSLGRAYVALDRLEEGRRAYLEGLRLYAEVKNLPGIGQSLDEICAFESSLGRHVEAMRLAGAAKALRESTGASPPLPSADRYLHISLDHAETAARDAIGDDAVEVALAEGRKMTVDDAVTNVLTSWGENR